MDWLRALQGDPTHDLQDALWTVATPTYWLIASIISGIGAFALFVCLMREVDRRREQNKKLPPHMRKSAFDSMMIGRLGWMGALILGAGVRLNSGMLIAAFALFVASGSFMAVLLATNWCHRQGSFAYKVGQILGEIAGYIRRPESTPIRHR